MTGFQLGIDFGTSHTVAVLRWPDGRAKPLLFDGSPMLPSAVYAELDGGLVVGRDAVRSARLDPSRFEPNPKRHIDDGVVLLGDREVPIIEVIGAVLGYVLDEARRTAGDLPATTTLTCPASWGTPRRQLLVAASARAGLDQPRVVEEPVAAATYFLQMLGHRMPVGTVVLIYDLGGGTFDVSLVERTAEGFRTVAVDGRGDVGGLDLDEALVRRIGESYGAADPEAWRRLVDARTSAERRVRQLFREDVCNAKERLSRYAVAELHVAGLDRDIHLTREEFEQLARPLLAETIRLTVEVVHRSRMRPDQINGVFLVGGSTRVPLVATMVHQGLRIAPTIIEQPELVVAEGSILVPATRPSPGAMARGTAGLPVPPPAAQVRPAPPGTPPPDIAPPAPDDSGAGAVVGRARVHTGGVAEPRPAPRPGLRRPAVRWPVVAGVTAAVAILVAAGLALAHGRSTPRSFGGSPSGTSSVSHPAPTSTSPFPCPLPGLPPAGQAGQPRSSAPKPSVAAQNGFEWYLDSTGFRITVPQGWSAVHAGSAVCFRDPHSIRTLAVDQWQPADLDLVAYWRRQERKLTDAVGAAHYTPGVIRTVGNFDRAAAYWEFTYTDPAGVAIHVAARAMVYPTGPAYAVFWLVPQVDWSTDQLGQFSIVSESGFQPAR